MSMRHKRTFRIRRATLKIAFGLLAGGGLGGAFSAGSARAEKMVRVNILVIEAQRAGGAIDPAIKAAKLGDQLARMGFKGAKLIDELKDRPVALGASITLEIRAAAGQPKKSLKVKLRDVAPDGTVKLKVAIPEMKFESDTVHTNEGAFMVALGNTPEVATFLAVIPKS